MSSNRSKTTGAIVAYKAIVTHGPLDMNSEVRKLMDEGWRVHGSPQITFVPADSQFAAGLMVCQAMVKYSDPVAPTT